ncbi:MAG: M67 family metallopeptidase [Cyclobacteriaceae bacterium]|nr:M67 family metallopeptidase [Cyclobacteriaceae bacterium HetDA_MAG_MS6]
MTLTYKASQLIKEHASEAFPNECVGFLYGYEKEAREINVAIKVPNSKEGDQRRRFAISPLDYMKAEQYADKNGLDFLGIYHSHPLHPAIPSEHDRKQAVPFFSYIIAAVNENKEVTDITSWRLSEDSQFEEEIIETLIEQ